MKMRLTSKDLMLLLGILVAALIAVTTVFYRDSLLTNRSGVSNKKVEMAKPAALLLQKVHSAFQLRR